MALANGFLLVAGVESLTQLAAGAGFSGNDLDVAVAVAMAESGGNPDAYNPEGSYGLWQIYLPDHPEFAGWNLFDPPTNARAAYQVYAKAGGRFTPWSTYRPGKHGEPPRYLAFLPAAAPLTLDAATGLPVDPSSSFRAAVTADMMPPIAQGPSFGTVLLWGAIGLFALWIFEEAM